MAETFGRYEILETIALGGMAEILLATSASLGGVDRTCVIKRILPQYSSDLTFVSMFIDEARITLGLDHPNIVRLFDFGQHEGTYFMAMEYVDGTDLAALLRAHAALQRRMPVEVAAFLMRDLARGLHHAHTLRDHQGLPLGIIHRDVSPQNTLLSQGGRVKLADFGIAAARDKLTLTEPGTVLGKAAYMSPEQAAGKPIDARTDLWSVGVILYELLLGERLFAHDNPVATVSRVMTLPITPPSARRSDVPQALDDVVMKALQRDVALRYQSGAEIADALDAFLQAHAPDFDEAALGRMIATLTWADDTRPLRPPHKLAAPILTPTRSRRPDVHDVHIEQLLEKLRNEPDVWLLTELGARYAALGYSQAAVSAYRTAAAAFAHRGLLVQALCAYDGARAFLQPPEISSDLVAVTSLHAGERRSLQSLLARFDAHDMWPLLAQADPHGFGSELDGAPPALPTPLFGNLGPGECARLCERVRVKRVSPGDVIVREGEGGDALYAVGRGRVVVWCAPGTDDAPAATPTGLDDDFFADDATSHEIKSLRALTGERVYLAALADGDFFGEFSFLVECPRTATVEALTEGLVIELSRQDVEEVHALDPSLTEPLERFYKERVIELMMGKSPVFSLLPPEDRRALLAESTLVEHEDQDDIVAEGSASDALFFIRRGDVEIYRDVGGLPLFINKLGPGQFFGEIGVIRGVPRSVSVRAMGPCSLFRIERETVLRIVDKEPRVRETLDDTIVARSAETRARIHEHQKLLVGI